MKKIYFLFISALIYIPSFAQSVEDTTDGRFHDDLLNLLVGKWGVTLNSTPESVRGNTRSKVGYEPPIPAYSSQESCCASCDKTSQNLHHPF